MEISRGAVTGFSFAKTMDLNFFFPIKKNLRILPSRSGTHYMMRGIQRLIILNSLVHPHQFMLIQEISYFVQEGFMTVHHVEPEPARNWLVSQKKENLSPVKLGPRRVLPEQFSRHLMKRIRGTRIESFQKFEGKHSLLRKQHYSSMSRTL